MKLYETAADASIDSIRSHTLFALEQARDNGAGSRAGGDADASQVAEALNAAQTAAAHAVQAAEELLTKAVQQPKAGAAFSAGSLTAEILVSMTTRLWRGCMTRQERCTRRRARRTTSSSDR